jgi:hypothetical protein
VVYFYNTTGGETPVIFLIRRNSEEAVELAKIDMPDDIKDRFMEKTGISKVFSRLKERSKTGFTNNSIICSNEENRYDHQ